MRSVLLARVRHHLRAAVRARWSLDLHRRARRSCTRACGRHLLARPAVRCTAVGRDVSPSHPRDARRTSTGDARDGIATGALPERRCTDGLGKPDDSWRQRLARAFYLSRVPTLGRKLRIFVEWSWSMFFPTDITHLRFTRSGEAEDINGHVPRSGKPSDNKGRTNAFVRAVPVTSDATPHVGASIRNHPSR